VCHFTKKSCRGLDRGLWGERVPVGVKRGRVEFFLWEIFSLSRVLANCIQIALLNMVESSKVGLNLHKSFEIDDRQPGSRSHAAKLSHFGCRKMQRVRNSKNVDTTTAAFPSDSVPSFVPI
jgi:hypothetical protein